MMSTKPLLICFLLGLGASAAEAAETEPLHPAVSYNRQIRPLLSEACFNCHGPDENTRKAKLRLDTEEGLFSKRDDYQIVQPGQRGASELFRRLITSNEDDRMPPIDSDKALTPAQIELIGRWIDEGAKWEGHWAFIPPEKPALPAVKNRSWPKNDIDYFILAKLEASELEPSPEAGRETLVRRASFDLTGLPPTIEEVDAFLQDESPGAYERLVDRLLASPRYGERMAVHWLDLARYADTHGYHLDSGRDMWSWRKWVIDAFNDNQPFDQFALEQIAGDLLPEPTLSQQVATGFNRNNMINFEGGAIPEEYLMHYVIDRVNTTSTVFLGLTMGCAQCHDHKYDPISQKDFYRFYAYFNAVPENGLDGRNGNATPLIFLPTSEQKQKLADLEAAQKEREEALRERLPEIDAGQEAWETEAAARARIEWRPLPFQEMKSENGSTLAQSEDQIVTAGGDNPDRDVFELVARAPFSKITAIRLDALRDKSLPRGGPGRHENGNFVLSEIEAEVLPGPEASERSSARFAWAGTDFSQKNFDVSQAIDGDAKTGWAIDAPTRRKPGRAIFALQKPLTVSEGGMLRLRLRFESEHKQHSIGRFQISVTGEPQAGQPGPVASQEIERLLLMAGESRSNEQKREIQKYYREQVSELFQRHEQQVAEARKAVNDYRKTIPTSMVMEQMDKPRPTHILMRGQYNQPAEQVEPGIPVSLGKDRPDLPPNRLGLAQWLIDPQNPLMARVTVNRFWGLVMGRGLVSTANDFGIRADWPSHPELLDWLATEFIQSGWDVKQFLKLLVTSAAYRQSSVLRPELALKDPENRLYARGPRFRLQAEFIRDTALSVSGLLQPELGGPSVFPYQPEGLWEELSMRKDSANWTAQFYTPSHGKDLYRRSMYTFWKRTSPPPSLQAFDAPDRETCVVERDRTTTPLQALVLMNDPTYVEASRFLAQRILREGGSTTADRLRFAFRLALSRLPTGREISILEDLLEKQRQRFQSAPEGASQLLQVGEGKRLEELDPAGLAAWTMVASTILNLDETITKN